VNKGCKVQALRRADDCQLPNGGLVCARKAASRRAIGLTPRDPHRGWSKVGSWLAADVDRQQMAHSKQRFQR
jgi:hypothetical protein